MAREMKVADILNYEQTDSNILGIVDLIRRGISFKTFLNLTKAFSFSIIEWSDLLHISHRTMQRYEKEEGTFDALHSERIVQLILLLRRGTEVFGEYTKFHSWLNRSNIVLGNNTPVSMLDNSFGINMIMDELGRIEHGILA